MGTLSVSVPDDLKERMSQLDEVNWSAVARKAFEERIKDIEDLQTLKSIVSKSKLTQKDADKIGRKISENMSREFMKMHQSRS
ncbi:hypothetical protein JW711_01500 [Candidatus Woesearchaeota archaeon]|nr:hypothetical protein [Candidatus Woesearchaeota archaeon]